MLDNQEIGRSAVAKHRSAFLSAIALCLMSSPAWSEEAWSLSGFQAPESALFDSERNVLYVSNVAGTPDGKDGVGFISKVSTDGTMQEAEWVTGLEAPKGLVMHEDSLYVSDIDRLVEINVETGEISNSWPAEGAKFLNDLAVDDAGRVFVSDMITDTIYVLENGALSVWLQDAELQHPNGLYVDGDRLLVAAWGREIQPDFSTKTLGHLLSVDLNSKVISPLGEAQPLGNLDGLEPDGAGNWLSTDWVAGALHRIKEDGTSEQLLDLNQGSADLEFLESEKLVIIPMMMDGTVIAHRLD
jgi:sugar lactone lactonase YvrE